MDRISLPVTAVFLLGITLTALGITILPSESIQTAGMALTGIGIAGMWSAGQWNRSAVLVVGLFFTGSLSLILSLTLIDSGFLFLSGMIITGSGIIGMWLAGKDDAYAMAIAAVFIGGISGQAVSFTIVPSTELQFAGMLMVGAAVAGMYLYGQVPVEDLPRLRLQRRLRIATRIILAEPALWMVLLPLYLIRIVSAPLRWVSERSRSTSRGRIRTYHPKRSARHRSPLARLLR